MAKGKRYKKLVEGRDPFATFTLAESIAKVKASATAKFDETIELIANLGINPANADQIVRGTVSLPNGTGKKVRVAVFAEGEQAEQAEAAGADFIGSGDLADKIKGGFLDFDVVIAAPNMMRYVGALGRILGPRGMMPNPKTGTVTPDIGRTVEEFKAGKIEYRADKAGGIHVPVGKASFTEVQLLGNVQVIVSALLRARPATAKGTYMKSIFLASTMGPSVKIDTGDLRESVRSS